MDDCARVSFGRRRPYFGVRRLRRALQAWRHVAAEALRRHGTGTRPASPRLVCSVRLSESPRPKMALGPAAELRIYILALVVVAISSVLVQEKSGAALEVGHIWAGCARCGTVLGIIIALCVQLVGEQR